MGHMPIKGTPAQLPEVINLMIYVESIIDPTIEHLSTFGKKYQYKILLLK